MRGDRTDKYKIQRSEYIIFLPKEQRERRNYFRAKINKGKKGEKIVNETWRKKWKLSLSNFEGHPILDALGSAAPRLRNSLRLPNPCRKFLFLPSFAPSVIQFIYDPFFTNPIQLKSTTVELWHFIWWNSNVHCLFLSCCCDVVVCEAGWIETQRRRGYKIFHRRDPIKLICDIHSRYK